MQCYGQSFIQLSNFTALPKCQSTLVLRVVCVKEYWCSLCFVVTRHSLRISDPDGVLRFLGACHLWCQARGLDLAMLLVASLHHENMFPARVKAKARKGVLSRGQKSKIRHCFLSFTLDHVLQIGFGSKIVNANMYRLYRLYRLCPQWIVTIVVLQHWLRGSWWPWSSLRPNVLASQCNYDL